ncbi:MAG: P-loop NTPase, partial [Defluviitaleaceae bacterium]|nr:P-loop NTPase [Defluviitaleaceae bacterium]
MTDQAERLRNLIRMGGAQPLVREKKLEIRKKMARVITVTSGKGGVGKSNVTLNLAIQFLKRGVRTVIIDADFGLANIEILAGISPRRNFTDVLAGKIGVADALTEGPLGLKFLSGGSGIAGIAGLNERQLDYMTSSLGYLDDAADI